MNSALDTLERKLEDCGGPFLCGSEYTLADCLFTCVLARLGMISMLEETFKSRKVKKMITCLQGDYSTCAKPPVDLEFECSAILPGQ